MQNTILCRDNSQATHIVEFMTIFGNRFSVLTDTPNDIQAVLDAAEEFIWAHDMEEDVPGYIADASAMPEDEIIQIGCEGGFENCLRENVHVNPISRADLLTYVSNGEFMQPYLYRGTVYAVTDEWGETYYATEYPAEENPNNIDVMDGFLAYVAANGYIDRVDLGFFETEADTIEALIDYYCD